MATNKAQKSATVAKKEEHLNLYITGVICASVVAVIITLIVGNFLVREISLNTKVIQKKMVAKQALEEKVEAAPKLIENYEKLGPQKELIANALPNTADFPQIVAIAESMAVFSGVSLKGAAPELALTAATTPTGAEASQAAQEDPTKPSPYNFSVTIEGSYPRVLAFLSNIEISARPMKVSSVTFTGNGGTVGADIEITTFYQPKADITDKMVEVK